MGGDRALPPGAAALLEEVPRLEGIASGSGIAREAFALACVTLADVFNPELIVVGGSVALGQGERLLGPARGGVTRLAFGRPAARARIVPAALGDDVGLVGALELARERIG